MNEVAGVYQGLDRKACRQKVLEDLNALGLLEKTEKYTHNIGHCYRCKTMIEPYLSKQWFVKVGPLAEKAIKAVENGETRIFPKTWEKTYFDWMANIKDWCISRQIWWGHQIPAWYCDQCGEVIVSLTAPSSCPACSSSEIRQETRCPGHLVQLGPLAFFDPGLAPGDPRASGLLPHFGIGHRF